MSDPKYCPLQKTALGGNISSVLCFKDCEWWFHYPTSEDPERGRCVIHQIAAHLGILARYAVALHVEKTGSILE